MSNVIYVPDFGYYDLDIPQCPNAANITQTCEIGLPIPQVPTPPTEPAPWPVDPPLMLTVVGVADPPSDPPSAHTPEPATFLLVATVLLCISTLRFRRS